jgi:hypothetical protein
LARDLEQVFRLASVPAEHKMTKTQVKFEKKSSSLQDPTALAKPHLPVTFCRSNK